MKRLTLKILGDVQGVTFRWSAREKAQELGVVGWIKNEPDGSVTVVAEGEEVKLKTFLNWCKTGPRWARVDKMEEKWEEINDLSFDGFDVEF